MHVGIIMDGNRRYARERNKPSYWGHDQGVKALRTMLEALKRDDLGIDELSLYTFSVENFQRPQDELDHMFELFRRLREELGEDGIEDARVRFVGRLDLFPSDIRDSMLKMMEDYPSGSRTINFLVGYDGQDEIVDAARKMLKAGEHPSDVDRSTVKRYSYLPDSMPVDLIIRTGMTDGARLSGFMLWHASYAELTFLPEFWPEFTHERLKSCVEEFTARERRFGR